MVVRNPIDDFKRIEQSWRPNDEIRYYLHADLAQKHDKCAIAISHVEKWVQMETFGDYTQTVPIVVCDAVVWWEPKKEGPVDLSEVKNWILNFRRSGFRIGMVTFDRWQSFDIQQELKSVGINTDTLSVGKKHYEDLAMLVYESRVKLPHIELLFNEMCELRIVSDKKVDHPRKGSKDLSDAVTGSIYNAMSLTPRNSNPTIEIHEWKDVKIKKDYDDPEEEDIKADVVPEDVERYLSNFGFI